MENGQGQTTAGQALEPVKLTQGTVKAWEESVRALLVNGEDLACKFDAIGRSLSGNPFYHGFIAAPDITRAFSAAWSRMLELDKDREHEQRLTDILELARPWDETSQKIFLTHIQGAVQGSYESLYSLKMIMVVAKRWGGTKQSRETAENMMLSILGKAINSEDHLIVLDELFKYAKKHAKCEITEVDTPWVGVWAKSVVVDTIAMSHPVEKKQTQYDRVLDRILSLGADINAVNSNGQSTLLSLGYRYNPRDVDDYVVGALVARGARWRDLLEDGVNKKILDNPKVRSARLKGGLEDIALGEIPGKSKKARPEI